MKSIEIVAGIIVKDNKFFCAQRSDNGECALKWEFPGGKIEEGENPIKALERELMEELGIDTRINDFFITVTYQYKTVHITMHVYFCKIIKGNISLNEHVNSNWITVNELDDYDWAEADKLVVEKLKKNINFNN